MSNVFQNGAAWLRADFHLHTKADKEFEYVGDENHYNSNYIQALVAANIKIGVITNHNKFDFAEFKALRETAKKKGIFLLPGVELHIGEGASGVHVLIVFSNDWLNNGEDRISSFIDSMYPGKTPSEYQNNNSMSNKNLLQTVEGLDSIYHDYFLVFAHVDEPKGLCHECGGAKFLAWDSDSYEKVKKRTLGFQKVRNRDQREKVKEWLGGFYPAEVEGSDPKNIEEIGRGNNQTFLKLSAFTFEAVKFALDNHSIRLRPNNALEYNHSYIRQIHFEGGKMDGQTIHFSPELNTFIGIRGSGKSSILEVIRYVLGIKIEAIEANESDYRYKRELVDRTLGGGGKAVIEATDRHRQSYQICRILEKTANVFVNGKLQPGVSIRETILRNPLFFGQKELAAVTKDQEKNLIEKLLETRCDAIRNQITDQKTKVTDTLAKLSNLSNIEELINEHTRAKQDAEHRLNFYKTHNLEEKLQKHIGFDNDIRKVEEGISLIESFVSGIRNLLANHEDELRNFLGYPSTENVDFFKNFDALFSKSIQSVVAVKAELVKTETLLVSLKEERQKLIAARNSLADEFAAVERMLTEELKTSGGQNISTNDFLAAKKKFAAAEASLVTLTKACSQKDALQKGLDEALQILNSLYQQEFKIIEARLNEISSDNNALKFIVKFKEDKDAFLNFFQMVFKGSGIHTATFKDIVEKYSDFIEIYQDFSNAKKLFGRNPENFISFFKQNLNSLLTFQIPNKYTITHRDKELAHHSLGQRASALILFVLGQKESDVIIIDQPEDDIDNQTIYNDVIKLICRLKPSTQFIFATHNPNFPVLGDAEQIQACSYDGQKISLQSGGIDNLNQQKLVVSIMEGGKDAFDRRKEIYQGWKH